MMKPLILLLPLLAAAIDVAACVPRTPAKNPVQVRQEQTERPLSHLEKRCNKMLKAQVAVQKGMNELHQAIEKTADKKPRLKDRRAALKLARRVEESVKETTRLTKVLEKDAAVAFPEVFRELQKDLKLVQSRLEKCDVGPATQAVQKDIIETLRDMTRALKKAEVHSPRTVTN